jgi:hypothetical protein
VVCTRFIWLRIGGSGGFLGTFHTILEILESLRDWWLLKKGSAPLIIFILPQTRNNFQAVIFWIVTSYGLVN